MVLRPGGIQDFTSVFNLYAMKLVEEEHIELTPDVVASAGAAILDVLVNPQRCTLLAVADNIIVGQLFFEPLPEHTSKGTYIYCYSIFVHPQYRKQGIAQRLIAAVTDHAKSISATRLTFFHGPEGCSKFYESLGATVSKIEYEVII